MRAPAILDRRGLRWLLNLLSPAPVVVLVHRGRRSGRTYSTPLEAITEDADRGELVVSPMWGEASDWYRNVLAGGLLEVRRDGAGRPMAWRRLSEEEAREALSAYRRAHPRYSRMVLWMLARGHGLSGERLEAVARAIPMLALRPAHRAASTSAAARSPEGTAPSM
jgi:deazaflavin-dependent oxidoreductase (nitroreductase family)